MNNYLATDSYGNPFQAIAHSVRIIDGCLTFWSETNLILALAKGNWIGCELDTEDGQKYRNLLETLKK